MAEPMQSFDLTDTVAIVTGASQGIGAAIAMQLAQSGAKTAVHYRSDRIRAQQLVESIKISGDHAQMVRAELDDQAQIQRMVGHVQSEFDGIDILINNAGMFPNQSI